jgi:hypothetical protein
MQIINIPFVVYFPLRPVYNINKRIWKHIQQNKTKQKILYPFWMMCITRAKSPNYIIIRPSIEKVQLAGKWWDVTRARTLITAAVTVYLSLSPTRQTGKKKQKYTFSLLYYFATIFIWFV